MSVNKVKIVHNETGQEAEVVDTTVRAWETVGWTRVDDEGDVEAEPNKAAPPSDSQVSKVKTNGAPAAPDTSKKE
jgi:hypothetical protein